MFIDPTLMTVTFWGTRGSHPQSGKSYTQFGGKTNCVSVTHADSLIILDAGTGIIDLGNTLEVSSFSAINLLLSHVHLDHIMGLPFFKPLWNKSQQVDIYCGMASPYGGIEEVLTTIFSPPYFPLQWQELETEKRYYDFEIGSTLSLPGATTVKTTALNHPGGGSGYRIHASGKSIVYLCDTDHAHEATTRYAAFCQGADLVIYDGTFTPEEYALYATWGHSTWVAGVELAKAANVKNLVLIHHDPSHDDRVLKRLETEARKTFANVLFAYDGMVLTI